MIFYVNSEKFVLDSFRLYKLYRFLGWKYDKSPVFDLHKLIHSVYNCPPVIEDTPQGKNIALFFHRLFEEIRYKNYNIYDIILGFAFYISKFKKKDEKKGRIFEYSHYNIDKAIRTMTDEQGAIDKRIVDKYCKELNKTIPEFCSIRSSGTNIFYELIYHGHITENLYVKEYIDIEEINKKQNNLSKQFITFKHSMIFLNNIFKQKEIFYGRSNELG